MDRKQVLKIHMGIEIENKVIMDSLSKRDS